MEVSKYGPLLWLEGVRVDNGWNEALPLDYEPLHLNAARELNTVSISLPPLRFYDKYRAWCVFN
jgi:hypothetical protein